MRRDVHCVLGHQVAGAHPLPAQSLVHAVKGWSVVEFQGHSLNQWVGYVSVWVPGAGRGGGVEPPLLSLQYFLCSLSLRGSLSLPLPFSPAARRYERGRDTFNEHHTQWQITLSFLWPNQAEKASFKSRR